MNLQIHPTPASRPAQAMMRIVARAWQDDAFRLQLKERPAELLAAEGIALPPSVAVRVVEDSDDTLHLALPQARSELSDADLDQVVGGELSTLLGLGCIVLTGLISWAVVAASATAEGSGGSFRTGSPPEHFPF